MNNFNEDEIPNYLELARDYPVEVRFLEYMPFDGNSWEIKKVVSEQTVLSKMERYLLARQEKLVKLPPESLNDVAKFYRSNDPNFQGKIGLISTITSPFCGGCNRVRITADGFMKNCLFSENETDLKQILRSDSSDFEIMAQIDQNIQNKKFSRNLETLSSRPMVRIGG